MNIQNFECIRAQNVIESLMMQEAKCLRKTTVGIKRNSMLKMAERLDKMRRSKDPLVKEKYKMMVLERQYIREAEKERLRAKIRSKKLEVGGDFNLTEIAKVFGLTRERVRQIESTAIKKIRSPRFAQLLKDFNYE